MPPTEEHSSQGADSTSVGGSVRSGAGQSEATGGTELRPLARSNREERRKRSSFGKMQLLERVASLRAQEGESLFDDDSHDGEGRVAGGPNDAAGASPGGGGAGGGEISAAMMAAAASAAEPPPSSLQQEPQADDLDAEYVRLKLALADARSRSDEQKLTIHKLNSEITSLQSELDVTRTKVTELRSAAEDTTAATDQLRMYADEAAEERDRLRSAADKIAGEREELQRKLEGLTRQRDDAMGGGGVP